MKIGYYSSAKKDYHLYLSNAFEFSFLFSLFLRYDININARILFVEKFTDHYKYLLKQTIKKNV